MIITVVFAVLAIICVFGAVMCLGVALAEGDGVLCMFGLFFAALSVGLIIGAVSSVDEVDPEQVCTETYHGAYTETDEGLSLCLVETRPT